MAKSTSTIPFSGTPEQEKRLNDVIHEHLNDKGALMPVLQKAQDIYGYLPIEVQKMIAAGLNVPLEEVYGVATFYSQFSLYPKGKYKISVCLGTACYVKGSGDVFEKLSKKLNIKSGECTVVGRFSMVGCRCVGAWGLGRVVTVNDEVYGKVTVDDIDTILAKYTG